MSVILGVPCEVCGAELRDPLSLFYDPETSRLACASCAFVAELEEDEAADLDPVRVFPAVAALPAPVAVVASSVRGGGKRSQYAISGRQPADKNEPLTLPFPVLSAR